jgi:cation transport regulator ChaC
MSEVFALEKQLEEAKQLMNRREMALKLHSNREFKKLILEEFCVNECARYAQTSADPNLGDRERADAIALAQAAGHLRRYLSVVVTLGNQAESSIQGLEYEIEAARQEEGE